MKEVFFNIGGMTCSACSSGIERSLKRKEGISSIEVNLVGGSARIQYDENKITLEMIFNQIKKMGYEPSDGKEKSLNVIQRFDERLTLKVRVFSVLFLTGIILYLAMFSAFFENLQFLSVRVNATLQLMITLIVMHLSRNFYIRGFGSLLHSSPNMDTLVALGSGVSFLYSFFIYIKILFDNAEYSLYFEGVCVILSFILLGKFLETYAKNKSLEQLNLLLNFYQKTTLKRNKNKEFEEILVNDVVQGDILKILPGGTIPVDSVIIEGEGEIDESMLSGENLPVYKKVGDNVFAGSNLLDQSCILQAQKDFKHSTISEILKLVRRAQDSKAPIAKIADKISGYFVPFILLLALVAFVFWWVNKEDLGFALKIFVSILVVSCPCALGLATPMAILIASTIGAKNSLLFKNAKSLENLHKSEVILFDKTGTLTEGKLNVLSVKSLHQDFDSKALLGIAGALESYSEHPIARAIIKESKDKNIFLDSVINFKNRIGFGVSGEINGVVYKIGKIDFFSQKIDEQIAKTSVFIGRITENGEEVLGVIVLEDKVRENARKVIDYLKKQKARIMILSGDHQVAVREVAQKLGIIEYFYNLKVHQKYEIIENLKLTKKRVMMVGDGLNDAPALALADISLAMGSGNTLSQERADVIILNDRIDNIINAFRLSKQTFINIKENLFWAFFYNIIAISVAGGLFYHLGFLLDPMLAAFAMSLSSLSVVLNAQRLRLFRFKGAENGKSF